MNTFKSKIDWWLVLLVIAILGFPLVDGILSEKYWLSIIILAIVVAFIIVVKKLKYTIHDESLTIFWTCKIDIHTIRKVYKTRNPISSPALSLDRLALVYNKYDEILISPEFQKEFIDELLKINPNIEVKN